MAIKIRTKIIVTIGSIFILLFLLGIIAIYNRNILFKGMADMKEGSRRLAVLIELQVAMDQAVMPANDYLITGNLKEERDKFLQIDAEIGKRFEQAEDFIQGNDEAGLIKAAKQRYAVLKKKALEIFSIQNPIGNKKGIHLMQEMDALSHDIIVYQIDKAAGFEKEKANRHIASGNLIKKRVDTLLFIGAVLTVIVIVANASYLINSVMKPIVEFKKGTALIRDGRLDYRVDVRDGVEMNLLADDFNEMTRRLQESYEGLEKKVEERTRQLNELNEKLNELSITDGLTEVYNHRHFYERLTEEIKRANRYGRPLSLIIADIDYFKNYNDTHGHLTGDDVLKGVARCIRSNARENDMVARYGGEEFSIILPETGKDGAGDLAERIRRCIAGQPFPHKETQPGGNLTISLGVATFPDDANDVMSVIKKADDALYMAKEKGRNRVEVG
ncbi:MAG: diguanylate cyclase [Deltaproteobacteria bacterium]|nr:diguanylate cyclase [Deltaproteobacteria bacterium]